MLYALYTMKTHAFRRSAWFFLATFITGFQQLYAQQERIWIPVTENSKPGEPVVVEVMAALPKGTELKVTVPGLWANAILIGRDTYFRLEFAGVQYTGIGFPTPQKPEGWWDFPTALRQVRRPTTGFVTGDGSVRKLVFPTSAVGQTPSTAEEMIRLGIDPAGARPGLPRLRALLALSARHGKGEVTVSTKADFRTIQLARPVAPAGFEGSDQVREENEGFTAPPLVDVDFYASFRGQYQGEEALVSEIGSFGPFHGSTLSYPLITLLTPATIAVSPLYSIFVEHLEGAEDFECPIPWDHWIFSFPFINGQAIRDSLTVKGLAIEASRSARYLILCPKGWRSNLQAFALWKQAKGLNVDFAYVGAGGDIPADRISIDSYIESYFKEHYCHGVYVLICGDQDVIPSGRSNLIVCGPDTSNADSDHRYEVLGSDRFPSVYVGRLSANSTAELDTQLTKILNYERRPPSGDWPLRATLCANSQMDNGDYGVNAEWPTKYSKAVEDTLNYGSYATVPIFQALHAGAASVAVTRATNADVVSALTAGRGQILYRGHGSSTAWVSGWDGSGTGSGSAFTAATHVNALTNIVQPIVYSIACQNGRMNQNDCIGEVWMSRAGGGAVAHFGASENSYTGENHERTKGIFRAIYQDGYTRLGPMLARAEAISYATSGGGSAWENNSFAYVLLGDPEMEIRRKAVPKIPFLTGLSVIVRELKTGTLITVVDERQAPVPSAFVQLTKPDGTRRNAFAGTEGTTEFSGVRPDMIARLDLISDGFPYNVIYLQSPALEPLGFGPGGFKVRLKNTPDGIFRIFGSSTMTAGSWQALGIATPVGLDQEFIDATAPVGPGARRFYRAEQIAAP